MADGFVKICGLGDLASARVAKDAGADALGFIIAPGKRRVSALAIRAIRDELGADAPVFVGVTVNEAPDRIASLADFAGLDAVQLSGNEDVSVLRHIELPVFKALRFPAGVSPESALQEVDAWLSAPNPAARVILDGHAAGAWGGTGAKADWDLVSAIVERFPVVLAGGLTPDNVADAIARVRPAGVDVSSGVEAGGIKNHRMIREFVANARSGFQGLTVRESDQ